MFTPILVHIQSCQRNFVLLLFCLTFYEDLFDVDKTLRQLYPPPPPPTTTITTTNDSNISILQLYKMVHRKKKLETFVTSIGYLCFLKKVIFQFSTDSSNKKQKKRSLLPVEKSYKADRWWKEAALLYGWLRERAR